ncbi:ATP-binding cassette sub-family G member 3-like protein [Cricetulus griseus]|uniref:ATP-binding cassette sub-family G member 3-like protein n=1 Tax=Cricetulus griseus TaxID=10029 RepID=A0A061IN26_CRIGR|nr:ATP-binding cassette sub-family G member 3-like protein [Cricetulus griseus]
MEEPLKMSSNNDPVVIPMIERISSDLPVMDTRDPETLTGEAVLSFHNISYGETVQSGFPFCKETCVIERLSNIRLLDVLAARKDPRGLTGDILINGKPRPANFKCTSGYVPQNDMVMHTVSVRENVEFSAALRLPTSITRDEKRSRINEVLGLLHLDEESNVKPRSKELRKRTSIAMELVIEHPILFLDDPTTDLDLGTTTDVISVLKKMSMRGRTIIFSINQPPYSIFRFFDSLTLVASGKVMFHGPAQEALEYFTSAVVVTLLINMQGAGYNYDSHLNPVDFFLDIINGGFSAILDTEEGGQKGIITDAKGFLTTLFTIMMLAYSASSLPLSIGAGKNPVAVPTLLMMIYFGLMLLFLVLDLYSGSLLPVLSLIQYISIPHYGFTNDMVMPTMTVRENVEFSAALRIPISVTRDEKRRRINEVLELLHLDEESNVKPRSIELRKRTSIAMELVTGHPILFLDDPTTDLDLRTTTDVFLILRRMSMRGWTIIFSINQPPYSIFRFFDSLTLVASGKVMFHGPAQEALEYFTSAVEHWKKSVLSDTQIAETLNFILTSKPSIDMCGLYSSRDSGQNIVFILMERSD